MKIVTIVGARPQFIKAAAVSRKLRLIGQEILVHTGQHYDENMSDVFFKKLDIPLPDYNLNVGSHSHAKQTAHMMIGIESILQKERPDYLLVYGDTNSTLAGALAASKLLIPIVHVEAGLRSFNRDMPEEQNRILTDCLSQFLFCPTDTAVENLKKEGIIEGVYNIGDVMCDTVIYYSSMQSQESTEKQFQKLVTLDGHSVNLINKWYLATIHRAENTVDILKMERILEALNQLDLSVIFPVHPRSKKIIENLTKGNTYHNIIFIQPIGYQEMLYFTKNAVKVVTDSGGLQKEAYMLKTPCITVREQTEWIETLKGNFNVLAKTEVEDIRNKVLNTKVTMEEYKSYYGSGDTADKLLKILNSER